MLDIVLISDPKVLQIPIEENHEAMVALSGTGIILDRRKKLPDGYFCARKSVVSRLLEAQIKLPNGYHFLLIEAFRPLYLQERYFTGYSAELKNKHPEWNAEQIRAETSKYVAPPDSIPPHSTGGAIDLTLSMGGKELDMGTDLNADPEKTKNACFTFAENISPTAKANRRILIDTMTKAGFVNYPTEWWHWSYGDRYWAFGSKMAKAAYYGAADNLNLVESG